MPIRIEVCSRHIHVSWHGLVTADDLTALFRGLPETARTCGFTPHVLHTAEAVTDLQLGTWDACEYSLRRSRTPLPAPVKVAFVATTPVSGALARVFRGFNRNPNLTMDVFPTRAEALAWLEVGAEAVSGPSEGVGAAP